MTAGHATAAGPTVTLVQLPNGQTVQVHGVIQAAQPSVIQSPQVQAVQVNTHTYNASVTYLMFSHNVITLKLGLCDAFMPDL